MDFKYPRSTSESHRFFTDDVAEVFHQWLIGLPPGKYRTADLFDSFSDAVTSSGNALAFSKRAFSIALDDAGLSKSRNSEARYHVKV